MILSQETEIDMTQFGLIENTQTEIQLACLKNFEQLKNISLVASIQIQGRGDIREYEQSEYL